MEEQCAENKEPCMCSCHAKERPPTCSREHGHTHCWLTYQTNRANTLQEAMLEIRRRATKLRGDQAYREFPLFVSNAIKDALRTKGGK